MTNQSNTWPDCIGEHAAGLAKSRNWAAACAATQFRYGRDIGSHGRALLADMRVEVSPFTAECGAVRNVRRYGWGGNVWRKRRCLYGFVREL
ncbi:MAG: hypothetical protein ABF689_14885 [Gluconobacter cerinus]|uniref:hypothetical protein n=1 Tax=Gluconobacter cerinus TaxID=38307 RepID=UPI0039E7749E